MAGELDDPSRQLRPRKCRRAEGRGPSGVFRFAGDDHDGAVLPYLAPAGSRRGQAARLADLPRDPVSAGPADAGESRSVPRLQGRAELSVAHQGRRWRGLLHRLGRPRRGADAVLVAGPGLRARARLGTRPPGRADDRAGRGRRARRGQYFRGDPRGLEAGAAELLVDHRLQPAEPRRRDPRRPVVALRGAVPCVRLGRGDPQIRRPAGSGLCRAGRRPAAPMDRPVPEPALFRAGLPGRRGVAQAPARRPRGADAHGAIDRATFRRRAFPADEQSRRA